MTPWLALCDWGEAGWTTEQPQDPLAPGSPEVRYIRRHTRYLVDNGGAPVIALIFVASLVVNLLVIFSVATVFGGADGAALGAAADAHEPGGPIAIADVNDRWWQVLALVLSTFFAQIRVGKSQEQSLDSTPKLVLAGRAGVGLVILAGVITPLGILWLWDRLNDPGGGAAIRELAKTISLGAGAMVVTALAAWWVAGAADRGSRNGASTRGRRVLAGLRMLFLAVLRVAASVLLPQTLMATAFAAGVVAFGAVEGEWARPILLLAGVPAVILVAGSLVGTNTWALHGPYRKRLFSCFGVLRQYGPAGSVRARKRHHSREPLLSHCRAPETPELLIGIDASTPSVLRTYQRRRPTFPYDSTAHQVYDADLFDAYRLLGYTSTGTASKPRS